MKADELAAIRDDVQTAVINADYNADPSLLPQLLDKLLTEIGNVAAAPHAAFPGSWELSNESVRSDLEDWADAILRNVQVRAISRIPYGEPTHDDEPEDHRDQPTA